MDPSPIKKKKVYLEKRKSYLVKNRISNYFLAQKHIFFDMTDTYSHDIASNKY